MRAGERAELEEMREQITSRIDSLNNSVDEQLITPAEKQTLLQEEFGDYKQTLTQINTLLHTPQQQTTPAPKALLTLLATLLITAAAITTATSGFSGAATSTLQAQHPINTLLADNQATRLTLNTPVTIHELDVELRGATTYQLFLEDATQEHLLYTSADGCVGCEETYHPPYLLRLESNGPVLLQRLTYREATP